MQAGGLVKSSRVLLSQATVPCVVERVFVFCPLKLRLLRLHFAIPVHAKAAIRWRQRALRQET